MGGGLSAVRALARSSATAMPLGSEPSATLSSTAGTTMKENADARLPEATSSNGVWRRNGTMMVALFDDGQPPLR